MTKPGAVIRLYAKFPGTKRGRAVFDIPMRIGERWLFTAPLREDDWVHSRLIDERFPRGTLFRFKEVRL